MVTFKGKASSLESQLPPHQPLSKAGLAGSASDCQAFKSFVGTNFAAKETEECFCQCPLFAEVNMSLSSSGPCCSWHLSLPQLCSPWLTPFRSQLRQKQGNPRFPAGPSCLPAPGMARTSQGGCSASASLFALCAVARGKTGWEMFSLDGKVDCVFVSKLLTLSTCAGGSSLKVPGTRGCPLKCFSEERSAPTRLYWVSPPAADLQLGSSIIGWRDRNLRKWGLSLQGHAASKRHRCEWNRGPYPLCYFASPVRFISRFFLIITLCITQGTAARFPADLFSLQQAE